MATNPKVSIYDEPKAGIDLFIEFSILVDTFTDFYIGENSNVTIIAWCGIHNNGHNNSQHDGIHTF